MTAIVEVMVNRGVLAGLAVVLLWASAFPAIRVAVPELGVIGLSFARLALATAVLVLVAVVRKARWPRVRDLGWIAAAGFFGMAAYQLLLNQTEVHVPAGTASVIVAAAPIVSVATARILFHERITSATVIGSVVALGGVLAVCLGRAGVSVSAAVWIAVAAMIAQGIYHPLQRPLLRRYSSLEVALFTMVAGTIMTMPLLPIGWATLAAAPVEAWVAAAYLGLLPSALGFVLWAYAVGRLPVAASTSLLYLVPPVAVVLAWLWLDEAPVPVEMAGGGVVLIGVIIIGQGARIGRALRGARHREPQRPAPHAGTAGEFRTHPGELGGA